MQRGRKMTRKIHRVFVGGLEAGKNFPIRKEPFLDLTDCNDLIVVDRQYFLENEDLIRDRALDKKTQDLFQKRLDSLLYLNLHPIFYNNGCDIDVS